jgi:hypothetical protein
MRTWDAKSDSFRPFTAPRIAPTVDASDDMCRGIDEVV